MLDATKAEQQKALLEAELETVGLRLNKKPPNIYFKVKPTGGLAFTATVPLTHLDLKMVRNILHEYNIQSLYLLFEHSH